MSNPEDINKQFNDIVNNLNMPPIEVIDLDNDPLINEIYDQFEHDILNSVVMIPFSFIAQLPDIVFEEVIKILKELHYDGTDDHF